MSLKEKLAEIKERQKQTATAPAPKEEPKEIPGDAIRQKLLELGAKKQVNPPQTVLISAEKEEAEKSQNQAKGESAKAEEPPKEKKAEKVLESCPVCGESFKVLAKHRCKAPVILQGMAEKQMLYEGQLSSGENNVLFRAKSGEEIFIKMTPSPKVEEQHHNYILLIDCLPVGIMKDVVSAESLTNEIKEKICEVKKVEHWKLVEYGGGSAFLQKAFEKYWYGVAFLGIVLLSTSSLEYSSVVETLITHAKAVYRGV